MSKHSQWTVLLTFGLIVGINQMLVLNFAPLVTTLQAHFHISEFWAGLPTLLNPLTYLIFGFHAGIALDHHGYKKVVSYAAVAMTAAALFRSIDLGYWGLLSSQTVIAVSGVYITSAIAKVVSDWFPVEKTGMATGVVMAGMLLGIAVGMGATALLVTENGLYPTMMHYAFVSLITTALFIALCKENRSQLVASNESGISEIKSLFRDNNLVIVMWLSFLIIGATNGFNAWFEKIMNTNGLNPEQASYVIACALLFSIIGAAIIPALSDRVGRRRPFLILSSLCGLLFTYPLLTSTQLNQALSIGAAAGFFQLPAYILIIALSAEFSGPARAGLANSMVMLTSSLGGLIIALAMERVGVWFSWPQSALVLIACYAISLVFMRKLQEPNIEIEEEPKESHQIS
ncbi:MFS transporter [Maricurvus nonylphenolicus]|uniref:MFS transporter n=1 Tax=Maricurvus nonylphenolicus TaxID=1008307 RepID=UPI0036F23729